MDTHSFEGRVAVVTGAGRGIGRAYALLLAARGARVAVNDLGGSMDGVGADAEPASAVAAEIVAAGGAAIADNSDVATAAGAQALVDAAVEKFGRVDIVINNAGIIRWAGFPEADADNLARHLAVHVGGSFNTTRAAWPHMVEHGYGRIVMTTSAGMFGLPHNVSYATAKGGVIGLTRSLATAGVADGIKVNLIAPAAFTRMAGEPTPAAAQMSPDLVAPMVAFLAHESCPVSGEIYAAGAGRFARVFIASTEGYVHSGHDVPTIEDVAENWATINDETGYYVPTDLNAWSAAFMTHLRRRGAEPAASQGGATVTSDWETIDYFNDESLIENPYPYFEQLRGACPVLPLPHLGVVAVTGYDEAIEVYRDPDTFSSCNSVVGPFATFPEPLEGDDVSDIIDRHRDELPMNEHMVTMDPPMHTRERALLMRLITPKRLKDNEAFMWRLADQQLDEFVADGHCEFVGAYSQPFAMLVVADLLGVPEADHERFRAFFGLSAAPGEVGAGVSTETDLNALGWLDDWFARYIEDRRRQPRQDVLTDLALATYPDGATPDVTAVVRTATFLFAAGQETTARLLAGALLLLADRPALQDELRAHREHIPDFLEEVLRVESPVKTDFRLARRGTTIGGVDIAAGTPVMLLNGAANRDPRRFESPAEIRIDRANAQSHIAFGRGAHACPGGPLARAEGRVSLERILERMGDIRLSEEHHGPPDARHFRYTPTWVLRGLDKLHIEFEPRS